MRLNAIQQRLRAAGLMDDRSVHYADPVLADVPAKVHDQRLIEVVKDLADRGGGYIDGDTMVAPGSWDAALASVGAAIKATDLVMSGEHSRAFSMSRPPGHHAERSRQLGFCLFNNIALAAVHAREQYDCQRIAIIDWDVHHGNGTQDIFYDSSDVFFVSIHQWPLFPGTGLEHERGSGSGEGYTLNLPLPAGSGDADYLSLMDDVIVPAVREYEPDLIMVSAGFDAHLDDPLAMMGVTDAGFRRLAQRVRRLAEELTQGQLVLVLEGGYNLRALSDSVLAVLTGLDAPAPE